MGDTKKHIYIAYLYDDATEDDYLIGIYDNLTDAQKAAERGERNAKDNFHGEWLGELPYTCYVREKELNKFNLEVWLFLKDKEDKT